MRLMQLLEACASIALDHAPTCKCLACRVARRDPGALDEMLIKTMAIEGQAKER
jgi:hypothetical protein